MLSSLEGFVRPSKLDSMLSGYVIVPYCNYQLDIKKKNQKLLFEIKTFSLNNTS